MNESQWLALPALRDMLHYVQGRVSPRKTRLFVCGCIRTIPTITESHLAVVRVAERYSDGLADDRELETAREHLSPFCNSTLKRGQEAQEALELANENLRLAAQRLASAERLAGADMRPFETLSALERWAIQMSSGSREERQRRIVEEEAELRRRAQEAIAIQSAVHQEARAEHRTAEAEHRAALAEHEAASRVNELSRLLLLATSTALSWEDVVDWESALTDREFGADVRDHVVRELFGNPFRPPQFDPSWRTSTVLAGIGEIYEEGAFYQLPILADALEETARCEDERVLRHCRNPGRHLRGCWVVDGLLGKM
jgi:hypothetical protein